MKRNRLIWHLLFPGKCLLCCKLLERSETILCRSCATDTEEALILKRRIPHVSGSFALWYYEGTVRRSLLRFKFGRRCSYASRYAALLAMKLLDRHSQYDLITWVPVSRRRKLKRGYDQVELIARSMAQQLGREAVPCLVKTRHTPPQSRLRDFSRRKANVLGAYQALSPQELSGKRILLLDDIITTGATVSECARTLLSAGAKEIYCAAVAAAKQQ